MSEEMETCHQDEASSKERKRHHNIRESAIKTVTTLYAGTALADAAPPSGAQA